MSPTLTNFPYCNKKTEHRTNVSYVLPYLQVDTMSRFYWSSFFADKVIIFQLSDAKIDIVFTPR